MIYQQEAVFYQIKASMQRRTHAFYQREAIHYWLTRVLYQFEAVFYQAKASLQWRIDAFYQREATLYLGKAGLYRQYISQ